MKENEEIIPNRGEKFKLFAKKVSEKLNLPEPKYLAEGFFGLAFIIDNKRILKITTDQSEALNAKKIIGKSNNFITNIFDVRGFTFNNENYYVIILEKVKTDFDYINGVIENLINWFSENYEKDFVSWLTEGEFPDLEKLEIELYNDNKKLYKFFVNFVELKKELLLNNIKSSDFMNATNLGFRGKDIVAFDLGIDDVDGDIDMNLFESIRDKLKSKVNNIENQRNKYVKDILEKDVDDLTASDLNIINKEEFEIIFNRIKEKYGNEFIVYNYDILSTIYIYNKTKVFNPNIFIRIERNIVFIDKTNKISYITHQLNTLGEGISLLRKYKQDDINEGVRDKLKSKVNSIQKQKEEYINDIIKGKDLLDLPAKDWSELFGIDDNFRNKFVSLFNYSGTWNRNSDGEIISLNIKKGKQEIVVSLPLPTNTITYSYSTTEKRHLSNGVSYTVPVRKYESVITVREMLDKIEEILNNDLI
jgi:hypothetical protein